jgi:Fic family protein
MTLRCRVSEGSRNRVFTLPGNIGVRRPLRPAHARQALNRAGQHTVLFAAYLRRIGRIFAASSLLPMSEFIYDREAWPDFSWDADALMPAVGAVRLLQGRVMGNMEALGFQARQEAGLNNLSLDVVKSSEIEGEKLNYRSVRSSIARKLGLESRDSPAAGRDAEGVVEMLLDATRHFDQPLTHERMYGWHAALFPTGYSGLYKIETGRYRTGRMQIVSGAMGKEQVHYEAPEPERVFAEMDAFLRWFNQETKLDPVLKAAAAHFRFIIIHPFDDGNGRIARALTDMLLALGENSRDRFYSMSASIMARRRQYYAVLKKVQCSEGDITEWLQWFLQTLEHALLQTEKAIQAVLKKADFWQQHAQTELNERQRKVLNKLLDKAAGPLRSSHYARMAKCSSDTALRDIKDLLEKGVLKQKESGGRSTAYTLV